MPRILVIDDQPHVRATISIVLEAKGFEVVAAESGATGIRKFQESEFDLVIVDIYMPEMDGTRIIKLLRERAPNLPIIAISGVLLKASGRTALDFLPMSPAFENVMCLQKPFRPTELLNLVEKAMYVVS
jgi:CheY-like chemotaxis protein